MTKREEIGKAIQQVYRDAKEHIDQVQGFYNDYSHTHVAKDCTIKDGNQVIFSIQEVELSDYQKCHDAMMNAIEKYQVALVADHLLAKYDVTEKD